MQPEEFRRVAEQLRDMWQAALRVLRPLMQRVVEVFRDLRRMLRESGLVDREGKLKVRRDRPAWQSPYGPPQRRGCA